MGEKGKSMPRVHINKKKYMISDFRVWVIGKMNVLGKSQADMGNLLGISQPAFGKRLRTSNFDYSQIITIFKELQATDEEIVKFMKL
jgi:predicted transcriptional regulator